MVDGNANRSGADSHWESFEQTMAARPTFPNLSNIA